MNKKEYYKSQNGLEVWDVVDQFTKDLSGVEAFDTGNIIKYACRWKKKNGLEDLYKLKSYVEHLIEFEENTKKLDEPTIKKTSGKYPWGSGDVIDNLREKKDEHEELCNLTNLKVKKHLLKNFEKIKETEEKIKNDLKHIIFRYRSDAEYVLNKMKEILYKYGIVYVFDFYELIDITNNVNHKIGLNKDSFHDNLNENWGWRNLSEAKIFEFEDNSSYEIILSDPIKL